MQRAEVGVTQALILANDVCYEHQPVALRGRLRAVRMTERRQQVCSRRDIQSVAIGRLRQSRSRPRHSSGALDPHVALAMMRQPKSQTTERCILPVNVQTSHVVNSDHHRRPGETTMETADKQIEQSEHRSKLLRLLT